MPYRDGKGRSQSNGQVTGRGRGRNRRLGRGLGAGMGKGIFQRNTSRSITTYAVQSQTQSEQFPKQSLSRKQELDMLKQKTQMLQRQVTLVQDRIDKLNSGEQILFKKRKSVKASVDDNKCSGCGICMDTCNQHAIIVNSIAEVDPAQCTGCGNCVDICPNNAISLNLVAVKNMQEK